MCVKGSGGAGRCVHLSADPSTCVRGASKLLESCRPTTVSPSSQTEPQVRREEVGTLLAQDHEHFSLLPSSPLCSDRPRSAKTSLLGWGVNISWTSETEGYRPNVSSKGLEDLVPNLAWCFLAYPTNLVARRILTVLLKRDSQTALRRSFA